LFRGAQQAGQRRPWRHGQSLELRQFSRDFYGTGGGGDLAAGGVPGGEGAVCCVITVYNKIDNQTEKLELKDLAEHAHIASFTERLGLTEILEEIDEIISESHTVVETQLKAPMDHHTLLMSMLGKRNCQVIGETISECGNFVILGFAADPVQIRSILKMLERGGEKFSDCEFNFPEGLIDLREDWEIEMDSQ